MKNNNNSDMRRKISLYNYDAQYTDNHSIFDIIYENVEKMILLLTKENQYYSEIHILFKLLNDTLSDGFELIISQYDRKYYKLIVLNQDITNCKYPFNAFTTSIITDNTSIKDRCTIISANIEIDNHTEQLLKFQIFEALNKYILNISNILEPHFDFNTKIKVEFY